jgi:hypothetical protein
MVQPSRAATECEVDLVRKHWVMQWAQTLDREMDEKLDYVSAVRKNARET